MYSLLAISISNSLSKKYDNDLNIKRIGLGMTPLTEHWTLDSIVLQRSVRRSLGHLKTLDTTDYKFLKNKWYCQYWTNQKIDTTQPYHKSKEIYLTKSFWIWENEIDFEYDTFINPKSNVADYEELENGELIGISAFGTKQMPTQLEFYSIDEESEISEMPKIKTLKSITVI